MHFSHCIFVKVQTGDVSRAQSLFDTSLQKSLPMFGAMMKGKSIQCDSTVS